MNGRVLRFGPFALHLDQRRLYRDDKLVQLGSRAFDLLQILASRAGKVVTNEELISAVWPNTFVAENNLRVNMTALRKALGPEGALTSGFISNVPGRGYSFTAAVTSEAIGSASSPDDFCKPRRALTRPLGVVFGRNASLAAFTAELPRRRLITITGSGGIGKTTLVLAAADSLAANYPAGVVFVDLAPISDATLVSRAIASALGCSFRDENMIAELIAAIGNERILLVLDSCEHVVDAVAEVSEKLLQGTSQLGIVATSRELLRAEGEWVMPLTPLDLPPSNADVSADAVRMSPAAQLFIERASAVGSGFVFDNTSAPFVAHICCQLDGIALAIELAASRVDTLSVKSLALSLGDRFKVLTRGRRTAVPRHQTLRAALDWSYNLLTADERHVLCRLSTLVGRFPSEAAMAIASHGSSLFATEEALANLVAKSLITVDASFDHTIFRLADTTRAYAFEKLEETGDLAQVQRAHAEYFLNSFIQAERDFESLSSIDWLSLYGWHIDDLRAALDWAFSPTGDASIGVSLSALAIPLWHRLSLVDECLARVGQALRSMPGATRDKRRMQLQAALGWPHMHAISGLPSGADAWKATLALAEELSDVDYQLRALWALWVDRTNNAEPIQAMEIAEQFGELAKRSREADDEAVAQRMKGATLHLLGDQIGARASLEGMLSCYDSSSRRRHIIRFQYDQQLLAEVALARVLCVQGQLKEAVALVDQLIERAKVLNHGPTYANILAEAACPVALLSNNFDLASHYITSLRTETRARSMNVWHTYADAFEGELLIRTGQSEAGLTMMAPAIASLRESGFILYDLAFRAALVAALDHVGSVTEAVAEIDSCIAHCERSGEGWCLPELLRLQAELDGPNRLGKLEKAKSLALRQGALLWAKNITRSMSATNAARI